MNKELDRGLFVEPITGSVILNRVMEALQASPDCYYPVGRAWKDLTRDQQDNWDARQTIILLGVSNG